MAGIGSRGKGRSAGTPGSCGARFALVVIAGLAGLCLNASIAFATTPGVNSQAATNVAYSSATLNGDVNPNGSETKAFFEYGTTVAYGSKTAETSVGSGSSPVEFSKAVSGLTPNVVYHYRIVASNGSGTAQGSDRTFTLGWSLQTTATPESFGQMFDVSCTAADACTAVGGSLAQRWNGSSWKSQTLATPAGAKSIDMRGVSCVSSSACFAVGRYMNASSNMVTLAEFWNGTEWSVQSIPNPTSAAAVLEDVSCSSTTECTAVGLFSESGPPELVKTLAIRWNGTEWKIQSTPNPSNTAYLSAVSCPSSSFCMAAGFYYDSGASAWTPTSMRWNGTEWTTKAAVKPGGATMSWLYGVSCTSSTECTAVGDKEVSALTHEHQTMAQRWNGTEWKLQSTPNPEATNRNLEDVSCTSSVACTAIGSYINGSAEQAMALRWNGTEWSLQVLPVPSGSQGTLRAFALSCVTARGCEAVGQFKNASFNIVPMAVGYWRSAPPTATTKAATSAAEKTATLNGVVNPNGTATHAFFEYGTTTAYGSKTAEANIGSGTSEVEKSQGLTGLSPNTTYHYRIVANNESPETGYGSDATFTTIGPPGVSTGTGEPDPVTGEAAVLNATVDPNGQSTTYQFEYGTSPGSYSVTVPIPAESAGSGLEGKPVSYKITGLTRGTTYYFRVTATNASGKVNGTESSLITPNSPSLSFPSAIELKHNGATLRTILNPRGLETSYWFEYGTTTSYGSVAPKPPAAAGSEWGGKTVSQPVSGLKASTLYHFRAVAENGLGTVYGTDKTFTTLPDVKLNVKGSLAEVGAPLKVFSPKLSFNNSKGEFVHSCAEAEFSGAVGENPGALQTGSSGRLQGAGGSTCLYGGVLDLKYTIPSKEITIEYTVNQSLEGVVKLSKFTLGLNEYFLGSLYGSCEYEVELAGTYSKPPALLNLALSGTTKLVSTISGSCIGDETLSGEFTVTSAGSSVEAKT